MTEDEKFKERIDAIALHLVTTAGMVEDNEKRAEERHRQTDETIDRILTIVERTAIAVEGHERRIERLEGQ